MEPNNFSFTICLSQTGYRTATRESSFNMTGGMKILRGGLRKFLDTRKGAMKKLGGAPKICILQNQQERGGH